MMREIVPALRRKVVLAVAVRDGRPGIVCWPARLARAAALKVLPGLHRAAPALALRGAALEKPPRGRAGDGDQNRFAFSRCENRRTFSRLARALIRPPALQCRPRRSR